MRFGNTSSQVTTSLTTLYRIIEHVQEGWANGTHFSVQISDLEWSTHIKETHEEHCYWSVWINILDKLPTALSRQKLYWLFFWIHRSLMDTHVWIYKYSRTYDEDSVHWYLYKTKLHTQPQYTACSAEWQSPNAQFHVQAPAPHSCRGLGRFWCVGSHQLSSTIG